MTQGDSYDAAMIDYDIELLDKLPQIVWRADLTGSLTYVNRFGLTALGVEFPGILSTWLDLVHLDDQSRVENAWHKAVSSGEDYRVQARLRYANGQYLDTLFTARRFFRQKDATGYWAGLCVAIDAQVVADFAPRYSGEDFRRIIEQAADAILISDTGFRYLQVNAQACLLTGYSRDELLEKTVGDLFMLEPDEVADIYKRVSARTLQVSEWTVRRQDDTTFTAEATFQVLADGRLVAFMRDATERKRAREQLETELEVRTKVIRGLATELTLAEQRERKKLATTLHDGIQQELYAIQFALAALKREADTNVQVAAKTIDEMLRKTISMTRQVTTDLRPAVLDNPDVVAEVHWLARTMKERYGLDVYLQGSEEVTIINSALRTIVFNLVREFLFNVVKHSGVAQATVSVRRTELGLKLEVKDEGCGFDEASMDSSDATGLGLSGAHKRLRLFGGQLTIEAIPEKGTKITMILPESALSTDEPY